ncbi:LytTR family transcriptional regulator DNA-binding domain-containing protein [Paenibacillus sp. NPDC057934]|uniref:LytTR family transcriptional regulator DNA-binding domain-containing protein n=1 Tax=Paenibacillus sp. NPDC057934 TaxID=3346282 RepID=UPI0036D7C629
MLYIESSKKSLVFHSNDQEPIKTNGSLKRYTAMLEKHGFIQVYSSYLANLEHARE